MNTSREGHLQEICYSTLMIYYQLACNGEGLVMIEIMFRIDPGCLQGNLSSIDRAYAVREF